VLATCLSACAPGQSGPPTPSTCPEDLPEAGRACALAGVECRYTKSTSACGVACDCLGGAWSCGPTCAIVVEDASAASDGGVSDAGSYGADCIAAGGQCVLGNYICAVPGPPETCGSGPGGAYCCLSETADCGQPQATTYVCPSSLDGGGACKGGAPVPSGAPGYEALVEAGDDDASYPVGCRATFPACNGGQVPYCACTSQVLESSATWSCFY